MGEFKKISPHGRKTTGFFIGVCTRNLSRATEFKGKKNATKIPGKLRNYGKRGRWPKKFIEGMSVAKSSPIEPIMGIAQ